MLKKLFSNLGGDSNKKIIEQYSVIVAEINALEAKYESVCSRSARARSLLVMSRGFKVFAKVINSLYFCLISVL